MEKWISVAYDMAGELRSEIFLAVAFCLIILMIIMLKNMHKSILLIRHLDTQMRELIKMSARQECRMDRPSSALPQTSEEAVKKTADTREDEELFSSVMREIFP